MHAPANPGRGRRVRTGRFEANRLEAGPAGGVPLLRHLFGQCGHWTQIAHGARFNHLVADLLAGADAATL